jgi:hypothetical protein
LDFSDKIIFFNLLAGFKNELPDLIMNFYPTFVMMKLLAQTNRIVFSTLVEIKKWSENENSLNDTVNLPRGFPLENFYCINSLDNKLIFFGILEITKAFPL